MIEKTFASAQSILFTTEITSVLPSCTNSMIAVSFISTSVSFICYKRSVIVIRMITFSYLHLILVLWCFTLSVSRAPEKSILKKTKTQVEKPVKRHVSFDPDVRVGIIPAKEVADQFEPEISILDVERAPLKPPAEIKQPQQPSLQRRPSRISDIFRVPYIVREETYTVEEVQSRGGFGDFIVDSRERIVDYKRRTFRSTELSLSQEIDEYQEPAILNIEDDTYAPMEAPEIDLDYLDSQLTSSRRVYKW
ncbi:hypothetical protein M514_01342 [Trichuris suis]|uniref:Uncharacterized protein n=1 Tax=Trichuris suis TaxID=68888 RepID=A0A085MKC6_9BILA|nr:hypothetical protein M513_01342 [Trichuris suis]KFD72245.1 hypothetical protein M514_01342 [Trichuris suis]